MDKYFIRDFFIFFTYFMAIWCGICIEKRSNGLIYENNHSVLDDSNELYSLECPKGADNCSYLLKINKDKLNDLIYKIKYGIKPCDRRGPGRGGGAVARANNGKCEDLGPERIQQGYCPPGTDFKDCCSGIGRVIGLSPGARVLALCDEKAYQLEQLRIHLSEKDNKICCVKNPV